MALRKRKCPVSVVSFQFQQHNATAFVGVLQFSYAFANAGASAKQQHKQVHSYIQYIVHMYIYVVCTMYMTKIVVSNEIVSCVESIL